MSKERESDPLKKEVRYRMQNEAEAMEDLNQSLMRDFI